MPVVQTEAALVVNSTTYVATQGVFDNPIGIATLGWLIRGDNLPPIIEEPGYPDPPFPPDRPDPNEPPLPYPPIDSNPPVGLPITDPNQEWWVRPDDDTPWHGPLSYRDANFQARRMTDDADHAILEVKYAQVGTFLGTRGGDPVDMSRMFVVYLYANGKMYLGGRLATFNLDKVPVE